MTSNLVAGVDETLCLHNCPSSSHSLGGRMESSSSSVSLLSRLEDDAALAEAPSTAPASPVDNNPASPCNNEDMVYNTERSLFNKKDIYIYRVF